MPKKLAPDLASFLEHQTSQALVEVLLELAGEHVGVRDRLARLQLADQPVKVADGFRKTLVAWCRSKKFYGYRETRSFAQELASWLAQVERELLAKDPPAALSLFESFIEADASWFDRADDSDGYIGDSACMLWLQAARNCESPGDEWPERLIALHRKDEYGARDQLLRRADLLLGETGLRQLVGRFEDQMVAALASGATVRPPPSGIFRISAALSLLSEALCDPDVQVRAVCRYSPEPNGLQIESFVKAYLKADRPEDALFWLQKPWGPHELARQNLLSDTLAGLGRKDESAVLRQGIFEKSLSVYDYQRWRELLPQTSHAMAYDHARKLALDHSDPSIAAELLLELDEMHDAEAKLISMYSAVDGGQYATLPDIGETLITKGYLRGATVVYRALLNTILERANSSAYGHAARYWHKLTQINAAAQTLAPLPSHQEFDDSVRSKHARKVAFWAQVSVRGN